MFAQPLEAVADAPKGEKILSLFTDATLNPTLQELLAATVAILGIRGKGKSNTAARLIEQLLANGVPLVIVDILGEYWGLKEKFPNILIVGKSSRVTVDIELNRPKQARKVAEWSLRERNPVILDVSDYSDEQRYEMVKAYFESLWVIAGKLRRPYHAVVEECHNWFPQSKPAPTKEIFIRIAAEGRSRGLGIIMVAQRSSRVDKDVITQADLMLLHGVRHSADVSVYQEMVPAERIWVKKKATALRKGEILFVSDAGVSEAKALMRETFHAGYTPGMEEIEPPNITNVSADTLNAFRSMFEASEEQAEDDPTIPLKVSIEALQADAVLQDEMIRQKDQIIADQHREIERLSKIVVTMPEGSLILHAGSTPASIPTIASAPTPVAALPAAPAVHEQWQAERQLKRFNEMLGEVQEDSELMHRLVLRHFLQNPKDEKTLAALANVIAYEPETLRKNPPTRIVQMGLLQRRKVAGFLHYTAKGTAAHLKEQYPDLDPQILINRLLNLR